MVDEGLSVEEARKRCWFVDSKGLVVKSRTDLTGHKLLYAHDHEFMSDFLSATKALKPTSIVGVSAKPGMFTRPVLEAMATLNDRPIVFSLSNPNSKTECSAEEAYTWTQGRAVFASGSPFDPVTVHGKTFVPAQGNNVHIFPGVGWAFSPARQTRDRRDVLVAARTLARHVSKPTSSRVACIRLHKIREVSAAMPLSG
jgi:malate dehydrogenase (oxaloacetate-decarboxylating)(NADP+)